MLMDMLIAFANQRAAYLGRVSQNTLSGKFECAGDNSRLLHLSALSTATIIRPCHAPVCLHMMFFPIFQFVGVHRYKDRVAMHCERGKISMGIGRTIV